MINKLKIEMEVDDFRSVVSICEAENLWKVLFNIIDEIEHAIAVELSSQKWDSESTDKIVNGIAKIIDGYRNKIVPYEYTKEGVRAGIPQ